VFSNPKKSRKELFRSTGFYLSFLTTVTRDNKNKKQQQHIILWIRNKKINTHANVSVNPAVAAAARQ
jgi:hypothetical protein